MVSRDGKRLWFVGSRISGVDQEERPTERRVRRRGNVAGTEYVSPGYAVLGGKGS